MDKKQIVTKDQHEKAIQNIDPTSNQVNFLDSNQMNGLWRMSETLSQATIIPSNYNRRPNDCFIALVRSQEMGISPFLFMENAYVVHGKIGLQGKMIISILNKSKEIKGRLKFDFEKDKGVITSCTCKAVLNDGSDEHVEYTLTWKEVEANGWTRNKESKWFSMTQKMFMYRTASWLADVYFPDLINGMSSAEDLEDKKVSEVEAQVINNEPKIPRAKPEKNEFVDVKEQKSEFVSVNMDPDKPCFDDQTDIKELRKAFYSNVCEKIGRNKADSDAFLAFLSDIGKINAKVKTLTKIPDDVIVDLSNNFEGILESFRVWKQG